MPQMMGVSSRPARQRRAANTVMRSFDEEASGSGSSPRPGMPPAGSAPHHVTGSPVDAANPPRTEAIRRRSERSTYVIAHEVSTTTWSAGETTGIDGSRRACDWAASPPCPAGPKVTASCPARSA